MPSSDRRRSRRQVAAGHVEAGQAIAGSAELLKAKRGALPRAESWQDEAWDYYDSTPELRFACQWYAAALSRVRLTFARQPDPGEPPVPLDPDDPADADVLAVLDDLGQAETRSQLLAEFAPHLTVPGIAVLVGTDVLDPEGTVASRTWAVRSADELRVINDRWEQRDETGKWGPIADGMLPVKVYRRHARDARKPDSPVRALLTVLRELALLTAHVEASATSRLAGAGVFAIPTEATLPVSKENLEEDDPFLAEFIDAAVTPIGDRDAASAVVPLLMRVPGDYLGDIQHITFATPFDESALQLREECRRRFAAGMDMPAEILLGLGDTNHWSAWQIEETAVKLHIVPMVETIVDGLTVGWARPTLEALAKTGGQPLYGRTDLADIVVWYDLAELTIRPDRSGDAKDLFAVNVVGAATVRRECGFAEEDAPDDDEVRRSLLERLAASNSPLAEAALAELGIDLAATSAPAAPDETIVVDQAPPPAEPTTGPPDTQEEPPPPPDDGVAASLTPGDEAAIADAAADAAVLASADIAVAIVLERIGGRIANLARRDETVSASLEGVAPMDRHTIVSAERIKDRDQLLAGAWEGVERVCARYELPSEPIVDAVDRYTRALLAARTAHSYEGLAAALDRPPAPA